MNRTTVNQRRQIGRCPAQPVHRGGRGNSLKVTAAIIMAEAIADALASRAVWGWVQRLRPTDYLGVAYSGFFDDQRRMDLFPPGLNAGGVCIVFLHGGFVSGTRRYWASTARHFRDLGYTCSQPFWRGSRDERSMCSVQCSPPSGALPLHAL